MKVSLFDNKFVFKYPSFERKQRLIDANRMRGVVQEVIEEVKGTHDTTILEQWCKALDLCPTVDAAEVVHGHWSFIGKECCVCSVCHKHAIVDYRFCPECGAKMDES